MTKKTKLFIILVLLAFVMAPVAYAEYVNAPQYANQGKIGTDAKPWGYGYFKNLILAPQTPSFTTATGFSISASSGSIYYVDTSQDTASNACPVAPASTGTTVVLPTPTSAIAGQPMIFVKTDSGSTAMVLYASGLPIGNASGTTDALTADAQGDVIVVLPAYNSAVSYWVLPSRIQ